MERRVEKGTIAPKLNPTALNNGTLEQARHIKPDRSVTLPLVKNVKGSYVNTLSRPISIFPAKINFRNTYSLGSFKLHSRVKALRSWLGLKWAVIKNKRSE